MREETRNGVLIIEDDEDFAESLRDILLPRGYSVEIARGREAAIDVLKHFEARVALIDLKLDGESGVELLPVLKQERPGLTCVLMTGYASFSTAVDALRGGADDYLSKPLDEGVLFATLERFSTGRRAELEVENAQLLAMRALHKRVIDATTELSVIEEVPTLGTRLLELSGELVSAEGGSLYLSDSDGLSQVHALDPGHAPSRLELPLPHESWFRAAWDTGRSEAGNGGSRKPSGWKSYGAEHCMVLPLLGPDDQRLGVLSLHDGRSEAFTDAEREAVEALVHVAAARLSALERWRQARMSRCMGIVETSQDAMIAVDEDSRVTLFNAAAERILGWEAAEVLGRPIAPLIPELIRDDHEALLRTYRSGPPGSRRLAGGTVIRGQRRDGEVFSAEASIARFQVNGHTHLAIALRDVSERLRLERDLAEREQRMRQSQRLESVSRLAGGVAHDLNNLLTVILMGSECAREKLVPEHEARGNLEEVVSASNRAAELTRGLLAFSRRQVFHPRPVDLSELVEGLGKRLGTLSGNDHVLTLELARDLPPIHVDPRQIEQVVMNLAGNARDAMPEGGELRIIARRAEQLSGDRSPPECDGEMVELVVSDTGCGMDDETLERVFDPFFTTKGVDEGTGLGLSIAHGIISQSGGYLRVRTALGKGTRFHAFLPVFDATQERAQERDGNRAAEVERGTVLVVEDDAAVRGVVLQALSNESYSVLEAQNAREAVELIEFGDDRAIDLIVTDVMLPHVEAQGFVSRLGRKRPAIPVLLVSGYASATPFSPAVSKPGISLLRKPFTIAELLARVNGTLESDGPQEAAMGEVHGG